MQADVRQQDYIGYMCVYLQEFQSRRLAKSFRMITIDKSTARFPELLQSRDTLILTFFHFSSLSQTLCLSLSLSVYIYIACFIYQYTQSFSCTRLCTARWLSYPIAVLLQSFRRKAKERQKGSRPIRTRTQWSTTKCLHQCINLDVDVPLSTSQVSVSVSLSFPYDHIKKCPCTRLLLCHRPCS